MWSRLGLTDFINTATNVDRSGSVIMEYILSIDQTPLPLMPTLEIKQVVVVGCWYLWWTRRLITHNESCPPMVRWPLSVLAITSNYQRAMAKIVVTEEERWLKPDPKFIKLNVDAAFFAEQGVGATAAIIRDERGIFLAAQCKFIPYAADAMTSEAMAMRDGLNLANSLGFQRVEAESDSLTVINCCSGQSTWWDAAAAIFAECVDISTLIGKVNFKHCFQSANQAAHVLANFSYCNKLSSSWTDEPPDCLVSKLVDDVSLCINQ